jgi:isocitrate dehydrogenase kinase/phosphatase
MPAARQEAEMERADWLYEGFDSAQARFLLVTAITHHRFNSPIWGESEVRKLHAELAEIDSAALQAASSHQMRQRII